MHIGLRGSGSARSTRAPAFRADRPAVAVDRLTLAVAVRRCGRAVVLLALAATLAVYTFGPLRNARWGMVDDHEIAFFAGPTGRLPLRDVPRTIMRETELGHAGHVPRFRPSYFILRVLESSSWGFAPTGWYRTRLVLYIGSVMLVGWVLAETIGLLGAVGALTWTLSGPYWFHVWGRLGTPESYAAFGCALWAMGIYLLWSSGGARELADRRRTGFGVAAFILGNALAAGAKENFVILAVPALWLALAEMRRGRARGVRWWACVVNVLVAGAVVLPLVVYFSSVPVDVYGRSVAPGRRAVVLVQSVGQFIWVEMAVAAAVALWLMSRAPLISRALQISAGWRRMTSELVLASAAALALCVSQLLYYNGDITPGTHYEFPVSLVGPGLAVAILVIVSRCCRNAGAFRIEHLVRGAGAVALVVVALRCLPGFAEQRTISQSWATATAEFTDRIASAAASARAEPMIPVVVTSSRPIDAEPIIAIDRFLSALGAPNPRFLRLEWEAGRPRWSPLEAHLAPFLQQLAAEGGLGFRPSSQFDAATPCFSIGLGTEPHHGCRGLGRF